MITSFNKYKLLNEKNYFDNNNAIVIKFNNKDEILMAYEYIKKHINEFLSNHIEQILLSGAIGYLRNRETPIFLYDKIRNKFLYGSLEGTPNHQTWEWDGVFSVNDLNKIKRLIEYDGKDITPNYMKPAAERRNRFIHENNSNLILEKSSLTALGVPREVMQPIQKDLAISPDATWDKINYKKDIVGYLRKGNKNLFIQIAVDSIKVIASIPSPKGTLYFIDNYIYRDSGWGGEFEKLKRQYDTLTQTVINIDPHTNIYKLNGDFSINKQPHRKMVKKEQSFIEFSEIFKTDFLKKFDKILKRITGTHYNKANDKISNKAKKIAAENNLLIKGLDNPLNGPNGLTILDEFLYQFEDKYSEYFGERIDLEELTSYFTKEKVMTMFMYFIYTGKILIN